MKTGRFFVLGDVQETSSFETAVLGREKNEGIPESLVQSMIDLAGKTRPDFVLLLGDLVFNRFSKREWRRFDKLIYPLQLLGIPIIACVGNHDRVPKEGGYRSFVYEDVGVFILNSCLVREKWNEQVRWIDRQMEIYESDSAVRLIAVFAHHPPYTNSIPHRVHRKLRLEILAVLTRFPKFQLFVSGHAHTYERIRKDGRTFIVAGGGGAPRIHVETKAERRKYEEVSGLKDSLRPFHFLDFEIGSGNLHCQVRGLCAEIGSGERKNRAVTVIDEFWK